MGFAAFHKDRWGVVKRKRFDFFISWIWMLFRFLVIVFLGWLSDSYILASGQKIFILCLALFVFLGCWSGDCLLELAILRPQQSIYSVPLFRKGPPGFLLKEQHFSTLFKKGPPGFPKEQHFRMWLKWSFSTHTCTKLMTHFFIKTLTKQKFLSWAKKEAGNPIESEI